MWKAFQRYRALDPQARVLFHRSILILFGVAISLRLRGFKKTQATLQKKLTIVSPDSQSEQHLQVVHRTCNMVKAGARYGLIRPTCLVDSLTLWYLLRKQNVPADLRIGVRKDSGKFEAHAWVEYRGAALNQPEEQHRHYSAFDSVFSDMPTEKS